MMRCFGIALCGLHCVVALSLQKGAPIDTPGRRRRREDVAAAENVATETNAILYSNIYNCERPFRMRRSFA